MRITISDIRAAGICVSGARTWFKQNGLDFRDFLENGIEAERLAATGDAMAMRVIEHKELTDG